LFICLKSKALFINQINGHDDGGGLGREDTIYYNRFLL
jgi:hypothetical protein